ncbi:MAG TPA: HDOD domain-containing protein [Leptospiraceae bacterium]|nr:HDOD domain-containing protein [Leptospiraceae bacterium]HMW05864.1 HDOD domain-containing protein [Leptospiraceae bacterium]HMX33202.1 HDOD domain-containing protein [Leptospiraceae bacterium]HMY33650.1 HDOD domain-containing protein [Leptospiraceae bacterium]HMZ64100.1 HDOD domain-containing protein [Leptospiraceae bacterium]
MSSIGINPKTSSEYKVVIADSSNIERKLLARFLTLNSFKITNEADSTESILHNLESLDPKPDIIFIDTTILGKEGGQFLKILNSNFPEIKVIFIISSKVQEAQMLKNKINYYIMKPFLKKNIEEKLYEILSDKPMEINSEDKGDVHLKKVFIPPIPNAVHKILLFEANTTSGSNELEELLYPDKSLCADLLRVANSSLYGRNGSIKALHDAITLLGIKTIKNIVIVQARRHMTGNLLKESIFKKFLYEFSIFNSLISHDLISLFGKAREYKEIFLLSSFRKMGMNILALNFPDKYAKILKAFEKGEGDLIALEKSELSLDHVQVGVSVMEEWKMPIIFTETVRDQTFKPSNFKDVGDIDRVTRMAEVLTKHLMKITLSELDNQILEEADHFYNPKDHFIALFGEDYLANITSHPFFEIPI